MSVKKIFNNRTIPNFVVATGTLGYIGLYYNKIKARMELEHPIVTEALELMRRDEEIAKRVGTELYIKEGLLISSKAGVTFNGPFAEAKFRVKGINGEMDVLVNASSHTLAEIEGVSGKPFYRRKYFILEPKMAKKIQQIENREELKKEALSPDTKLWGIDFINAQARGGQSVIIKPNENETVEVGSQPRTTLYELVEENEVA